MSAMLSIGVVTIAATIAAAPSASAIGGPCGSGGSGSAGSMTGSLGSLTGSLGSGSAGTGSLANALPWITGSPNGALPVLTGRTKAIEMVTGPGSPNNTIERFNVSGTDLGIMWDNGLSGPDHDVLMAFGDTVGDCDTPGDDWRSNVLFRSNDTAIADGMKIDSSPLDGPNHSKEIIPGFGIPGEFTTIPTAGISYGGVQYIRFMSVRSWDEPGAWTTNYSALAFSTDNGENWELDPATVRANTEGLGIPGIPAVSPINSNFQQSAFVDGRDGYLYEYGTPSGRFGKAILARVAGADIRNLGAYEYWDGSGWSPRDTDAVQVIKAPVSELAVQWNDYLNKYVAMYTSAEGNLVIRQADQPQGPWSGTQTLLSGITLPALYGGFMHPWASGQFLEFVATTWDRYNVIYMRTDLNGLKMASSDSRDRPDPATTGEARVLEVTMPEDR
ncbi:DUF4185 domain-containing protein [Rhodococcus erythropolis]|uniref:DUF4185 domain-containing protein n=1 Tax=Rhodococcus TaxID=1827 RepID=UPI0009B98575|nr:DUF4185 domain-containing protein [Rhodococcus sp. 66b]OQM78146.1 hypothetical protein B0E55_05904 [Rhodococcus sp. 66b]OXM17977.1 hypothetical protein CBI33_28295 [Rhodococcus erythropolis]